MDFYVNEKQKFLKQGVIDAMRFLKEYEIDEYATNQENNEKRTDFIIDHQDEIEDLNKAIQKHDNYICKLYLMKKTEELQEQLRYELI